MLFQHIVNTIHSMTHIPLTMTMLTLNCNIIRKNFEYTKSLLNSIHDIKMFYCRSHRPYLTFEEDNTISISLSFNLYIFLFLSPKGVFILTIYNIFRICYTWSNSQDITKDKVMTFTIILC